MLLNQIEERLASSAVGLNKLFAQLYDIRRERMKQLIAITTNYLVSQNSCLSTRDGYLFITEAGKDVLSVNDPWEAEKKTLATITNNLRHAI